MIHLYSYSSFSSSSALLSLEEISGKGGKLIQREYFFTFCYPGKKNGEYFMFNPGLVRISSADFLSLPYIIIPGKRSEKEAAEIDHHLLRCYN